VTAVSVCVVSTPGRRPLHDHVFTVDVTSAPLSQSPPPDTGLCLRPMIPLCLPSIHSQDQSHQTPYNEPTARSRVLLRLAVSAAEARLGLDQCLNLVQRPLFALVRMRLIWHRYGDRTGNPADVRHPATKNTSLDHGLSLLREIESRRLNMLRRHPLPRPHRPVVMAWLRRDILDLRSHTSRWTVASAVWILR